MIDYYTTGGGSYLIPAFNALAAFANSDFMESLALFAISAGVLLFAVRVVMDGDVKGALKWMLVASTIWLLFVEVKRTVQINDSANPLLANRVVDNVPWGVAVIGGYASQLGRVFSDRLGALTSTPNAVSYQQNGFIFGAGLLAQTTRFRVIDDKLSGTLTNYIEQCILYGSLLQHSDFEVVANSDDLSTVLPAQATASGTFLSIRESGGNITTQTETCAAGWPEIRTRIDADVERVLLREASARFPASEFSDAEKIARYTDSLEGWQQQMIGATTAARDRLRQGMLISAMDDSVGKFLASTGNSAAMQHYIAAKTESQALLSKQSAGLISTKFVPLAKVVFEVLYVVLFPMAALVMMIYPNYWAVMKAYFGGFMWLATWEAVSVPLHNMAIGFYETAYAAQAGFIGSDGTRELIISYANHLGVRSVEQDVAATASYFLASAPVIALGIVFGASRLGSVATGAISSTQGSVSEVAREGTSGTVSVNTPQLDNVRSNSFATSTSVDAGRSTGFMPNGAMFTRNADGSIAFQPGSATSTGGIEMKFSRDMGERATARSEQMISAGQEQLDSYSSSVAAVSRQMTDFMNNAARNQSFGKTTSSGDTVRANDGVFQKWDRAVDWLDKQGFDAQTGMQALLGGNLGLGAQKAGASFGISGSAGGRGSVTSSDQATKILKAAEADGVTKDIAEVMDFVRNQSGSTNDSTGASSNTGFAASLDTMTSSAQSANEFFRQARSYSQAAEVYSSAGFSIGANEVGPFASHLNDLWSHMPESERMERISNVIMNRGQHDPEAVHAGYAFMAGQAADHGVSAAALGTGLALNANDVTPSFVSSFPSSEAKDRRESVIAQYEADQDRIFDRAYGGGHVPLAGDVSGDRQALEESVSRRSEELLNQAGHVEASSAVSQDWTKDAVEEEIKKSLGEHAMDTIKEKAGNLIGSSSDQEGNR